MESVKEENGLISELSFSMINRYLKLFFIFSLNIWWVEIFPLFLHGPSAIQKYILLSEQIENKLLGIEKSKYPANNVIKLSNHY